MSGGCTGCQRQLKLLGHKAVPAERGQLSFKFTSLQVYKFTSLASKLLANKENDTGKFTLYRSKFLEVSLSEIHFKSSYLQCLAKHSSCHDRLACARFVLHCDPEVG